jgi:beta-glucuronidase
MLYGGILEPVTLETLSTVFISDLTTHAIPNGPGATVDCEVEVTSLSSVATNISVGITIAGATQSAVAAKRRIGPGAKVVEEFSISMPKADPWSPAKPRLYTLMATIDSDRPLDTLTSRFGIRKIETRGRDILINGERFVAKGVNRYDE